MAPQNRWLMENPIKMYDLGVPLFLEPPIYTPILLNEVSSSMTFLFTDPWNPRSPLFVASFLCCSLIFTLQKEVYKLESKHDTVGSRYIMK